VATGEADPHVDFRLGEWLVQPSLDRLSREGESVRIEPKVMDVLICLARCAGRVVSRDGLVDEVWAKQYVAESALSRVIAELRSALHDDARNPRFIETITKRGYRLIAPVEWMEPAAGIAYQSCGAGAGRAPEPAHDRPPQAAPVRVEIEGCALRWRGQRIPLAEGENLIGKDPEALVRISSSTVSRRHARIVLSGGNAVLEDLDSKNGTYLCGRRVTTGRTLKDGDTICVGPAELVFLDSVPEGSTRTEMKK
jgi:DNA-binding winged helix-turn-helix (wHTH) protein